MKLLLEFGGKAWLLNFTITQAHVRFPGDDDDELDDDEPIRQLPVDPHGTTMAHLERRSAMEDLYDHRDIPFGFGHGSGS